MRCSAGEKLDRIWVSLSAEMVSASERKLSGGLGVERCLEPFGMV
jgi:hypothetical protein